MSEDGQARNIGYGRQTPFTSNDDLSVVAFVVRQMILRLSTMKLVKVVAVHGGGADGIPATVDVLPLVNQIDGSGNSQPHSTVYGIPCWRMQAGGWAVVLDPVVDDIGYVSVSDSDISNVKATRKQANPGSERAYGVSDGVYVGGVLNDAPTGVVHLKSDGYLKIADQHSNVLESSASGWALTGDLAVTGKITATETITGLFGTTPVGLTTHVHTSATPGSPTSPPTPGT